MKVKFILRRPGDHHTVAQITMDAVPRVGEVVSIDEESHWTVHSVRWDIGTKTVEVLIG